MKTPIIDALDCISVEGNAGNTPELSVIAGDSQVEIPGLAAMEEQLKTLRLDSDTIDKIIETAATVSVDSAEVGFRRGFRMAVQLMLECL